MSAAELREWVQTLEAAERRLLAALEAIPDDPLRRTADDDRKRMYALRDLDVLRHGAPEGIQGTGSILDVLANAGVEVTSVPSWRPPLAKARRRLAELDKAA